MTLKNTNFITQRSNEYYSRSRREVERNTQHYRMQAAINNATRRITGNQGGYVVIHDSGGDGYPKERNT